VLSHEKSEQIAYKSKQIDAKQIRLTQSSFPGACVMDEWMNRRNTRIQGLTIAPMMSAKNKTGWFFLDTKVI
jgi:hypothetical protein